MKRLVRGRVPTTVAGRSPTEEAPGSDGATNDGTTGDGGGALLRRTLGRSDLRAVPEARRALRELLDDWGPPERSETAELLTSELVTNALVHTDHDAVLTATVGPKRLRVEVRDFVGRRPRLRVPVADDGTNGRGLVLVQSLADAWGVRALGVGKVVWFELDGGPA
ncbi:MULTISPECIES: ATP-binding protein [unclassified Streptomyces]|uniref:ATP-binding protein n=1 Tax=unclassified Streptomyces TaxID=2593676 RepID=UPI002E321455|nr:ATP-binding protein [Streptomyces sp. NBC_01280]WSE17952.1 ATP-binding protein [Streptomyces sp. NBC_01397]